MPRRLLLGMLESAFGVPCHERRAYISFTALLSRIVNANMKAASLQMASTVVAAGKASSKSSTTFKTWASLPYVAYFPS
jgi:hypothetical protein